MNVLITSISFDQDEISYLDGSSSRTEYGNNVEVNYLVTAPGSRLEGSEVIPFNIYREMKLSDLEGTIRKAALEKLFNRDEKKGGST